MGLGKVHKDKADRRVGPPATGTEEEDSPGMANASTGLGPHAGSGAEPGNPGDPRQGDIVQRG